MRIILGLGPYVPTTHRWLELLSIWQLVFTTTVNCLPLLLGLGLLDLWQTYMLKGNTKFTNRMMPNFSIFVHPACSYTTEIPCIMQKCCTLKEKWNERKKLVQKLQQCLKFSVQIDGAVNSQQQDKKYVFVRYLLWK